MDRLEQRDFDGREGQVFRVPRPDGAPLELELLTVTGRDHGNAGTSFSIIFRGTLELFAPQGTYAVEHDDLGTFPLFLVPVGRESDGFRYEAVFTRERPRPDATP